MERKIIHKITASGKYSKSLVLPRNFLRVLNWRENQKVEIQLDEKKKQLVIRDAKN